MPTLHSLRRDITYMRSQILRQRKEIASLQRANISTAAADALLARMLAKVDALCADRDKMKAMEAGHNRGRVLGGRRW